MGGLVDLHMHTNVSADGELTPEQMVARCDEQGLQVIAISDHNAVAGVARAKAEAEKRGLLCLSAVELDCDCDGISLHVLGYGIDERDEGFARVEQDILVQEKKASALRLMQVEALGIALDENWLCRNAPNGVMTGELLAESALGNTRNHNNPILDPYRPGGARSDNPFVNFYWDFCAQGKPAYVPMHYIALKEALEMIHGCGGVAVLAHPGANIGCDETKLAQILQHDLDGIEVFSSYHNEETTRFYREVAKKRGLLMTIGSDFHGKTKPAIEVGGTPCDCQKDIAEALTEKISCRTGAQIKLCWRDGGAAR